MRPFAITVFARIANLFPDDHATFAACEVASARVDSRDAAADSELIVVPYVRREFTFRGLNVAALQERRRAVPQPQKTFPPSPPGLTAVTDIMQPPLTTVERYDHAAAAAYLMRHAGTTALMVLDELPARLIAITTEADVANAVAAGKTSTRSGSMT